jgi:hypothetical protein
MEIFSRALTEALADYPLADIHETVTFWHSLNIAASHLRVPAEESAVAAALAKTDYAGYCRTLFQEQGYQHLLIDTGYQPQDAWALHPLAEALDLQIHPIVRLETLAEQLMAECSTVDDWVGAIKIHLKNARNLGYIGVKSIVAYRSGLHVHPVARDIAQEAFHTMQQTGQTRLADPDLLNYVLWNTTPVLIDQALPLQFHTGYGDPDTDLLKGNPLLL